MYQKQIIIYFNVFDLVCKYKNRSNPKKLKNNKMYQKNLIILYFKSSRLSL